jgi:alcohol dehydrogenase class IV
MITQRPFTQRLRRIPETYTGRGSASALAGLHATRVIVVTTPSVRTCAAYAKLTTALGERLVTSIDVANSTVTEALAVTGAIVSSRADTVIAVGGGTVIDVAKVACALARGDTDDALTAPAATVAPSERLPDEVGTGPLPRTFVIVPTTPSTGSEVSAIAVLRDDQGGKRPLVSDRYLADHVILDSAFLDQLTPESLREFAADAFAHAAEALVSRASTDGSRGYATMALEHIEAGCAALAKDATAEPNASRVARERLQLGGYFAGIAQTNAFVGVAHAIAHAIEAHPITTRDRVSHATAVAACLSPALRWQAAKTGKPELAALADRYRACGLPEPNAGTLTDADTTVIAEAALRDPSHTTSPVRFDAAAMTELVREVLGR